MPVSTAARLYYEMQNYHHKSKQEQRPGKSENLPKKAIASWIQENLSDKWKYDLVLTQLSDGNYRIEIAMHGYLSQDTTTA